MTATDTTLRVGRFEYDRATQVLRGPEAYMREQGNAKLDAMLDGRDEVYRMTVHLSPDPLTALLVHLQTDYAAWRGAREFQLMREAAAAEREHEGRVS